jgi:phytoene synthase
MAGNNSPPFAEEIVRRSGSNLAFALAVLPREKRADMRVFYAFCRVIDDIADSGELNEDERRRWLDRWEELCDPASEVTAESGLEIEFVTLRDKYHLPPPILKEIIAGVRMDLERAGFDRVESLKQYCYRVACAVGLISVEIFGYRDPGCRDYAEKLGYAFQWTNILRDVGEDAAKGRIYLPLEDLRRFDLSEEEILGRTWDDRFVGLMEFQCQRAEDWYRQAAAALPEPDRRAMKSAELMRVIYFEILQKMKKDRFRVFEKRYRLSKGAMLCHLMRAMFG